MFARLGKVYYKHPRCVARVYVGARVDRDRKSKIGRLLKQLKIPCQIQRLDGYVMQFQKEGEFDADDAPSPTKSVTKGRKLGRTYR